MCNSSKRDIELGDKLGTQRSVGIPKFGEYVYEKKHLRKGEMNGKVDLKIFYLSLNIYFSPKSMLPYSRIKV